MQPCKAENFNQKVKFTTKSAVLFDVSVFFLLHFCVFLQCSFGVLCVFAQKLQNAMTHVLDVKLKIVERLNRSVVFVWQAFCRESARLGPRHSG